MANLELSYKIYSYNHQQQNHEYIYKMVKESEASQAKIKTTNAS